ncbi:zinc finger CCHC domain-containing protein 14 isoform X3 [Alligator sinensis]|uniref:Zinc finger CCHC domain-containing protein 14 isoform X3 n=1 Tax=Alligator sinensis TaxID=38654 RepID=A0A3Q0GHF8_ALLSI|nr:zinc finger CCHC domain-containing protein 14 isoform X3 [Alligator sinensis]
MVEKRCPRLQRDGVYRWFSELPSPQRVEFLCGLLDLCIPLELRFLGACLEDLARKDYHSLRDSEIKANNPADLGNLTNLTDEVVRSKLLISLALLGSAHREAAGVLFRTLTHIDSVIHNYGLQLNEGRTGDEFLLLFTMASNHPAFSFHQKQVLRKELTQIQNIMASTSKTPGPSTLNTVATYPGCHKVAPRSETPINSVSNSLENALHTSAHSIEESLPKRPSGKHSKVNVEKVELKGLAHKKNERNEYSFEVLWSDSSVTLVTKSSAEVTEFISKLSQLYPEENLEKFIPCLAGPDSFYLDRNHMDLESDLSPQAPQPQEQNGILDWLRKLRLHKYYPVFKQLTMEKFLSLTEEDLNKFESLTMGAKKKLKTQLELEKEKSEKRCLNPTAPSSVTGSGVARVPPTTHIGPLQNIRGNHAAELRVDVDQPSHPLPREGSSSEYSSSSSSPMGIHTREESSDSAEENERRLEIHLDGSEKEKPVMLLNHFTSSSARPTAQVLPVQNDVGSNPSGHHTLSMQVMPAASTHITPSRMLNSVHKSERGNTEMKLLSLLSLEERNKVSPGARSSIKMEKSFGNTVVDVTPTSSHQPLQVLSGVPENSSPASTINFGHRTKVVHASSLDRVIKTPQQPALIVETSTAPSVTSSTVFQMARPPMKLLVSSSVPTDSAIAGQTSCSSNMQITMSPAIINPRTALYTANTKVAFSAMSSMPVAPMPGSFCANNNTASSSSHPSTSFANMANLPSCPVPSSSPTLSSAAENNFYSSSSSSSSSNSNSSSGSAGNIPVPNQNHHHHHHQQQQQPPGCMVCSSCGCSGNCGSSGLTVSYANYFQHPFSGPSMFTFPFLPFNPLCSNGYINTQQYNSSTTFPMVHSPYNSGLTPDSVMSGQSAFAVPPMQNFMAGTAGVYQAQGMMGTSNGSNHKKNGNLSCYNCGASGHRAQDCKQPPMDFNRQECCHIWTFQDEMHNSRAATLRCEMRAGG